MTTPGLWQRLNAWLLAAFVALLIVAPWGYAVIPLLAACVALAGTLLAAGQGRRGLDAEDGLWCLALLAFAGLWLWDVWRTGHWPVGEGNQGVALPLWPVLAAGLLVWLRCHPPRVRYWWLGIACGASMAGGIALFERLLLGYGRVSNDMNPIPFGNLALLLGCLSLLGALWWLSRNRSTEIARHGRGWGAGLALAAAMAGVLASLLSGTRGGWIAAPFLLWLVFLGYRQVMRQGLPRLGLAHGVAGAIVLLLIIAVALPSLGVSQRLGQLLSNAQQYWQGEARGTNLGVRLEMWRGGWQLFIERPLAGWGEGRLEAARDALVAAGTLHPGVSYFDQLHSDIIDTAARRGLLGVATLAMLYGVPLLLFARRLGHGDVAVRLLALAGMMIPLAFLVFGLSQSMFRDVRGLSGYLGLCIGCWAVLRHAQGGHAQGAGGRQIPRGRSLHSE